MKFIKKTDLIIIAIILLASAVSWFTYKYFTKDEAPKAEIYYYTELVKTIDLGSGNDIHFSIDNEPDVIFHVTADGTIRFEQSDCPDQICINTGELSRPGQFGACLPNGIVIKIIGNKNDDEPDIIIGSSGGQ